LNRIGKGLRFRMPDKGVHVLRCSRMKTPIYSNDKELYGNALFEAS
jgi:hypothetical protein